MQHHIEEGFDHIYLLNDRSTDGLREALACVDASRYTLIDVDLPATGRANTSAAKRQELLYTRTLRRVSAEWLAVHAPAHARTPSNEPPDTQRGAPARVSAAGARCRRVPREPRVGNRAQAWTLRSVSPLSLIHI